MTLENLKVLYTCGLLLGHTFIFLLGSDDLEGCKCLSGFIMCDTLTYSPTLSPES